MRYMHIELTTAEERVPQIIYSEIDDVEYEVRKVEIYFDGSVGYASSENEVGKTLLADQVIPTLEEIDNDNEIIATQLSREDFEIIWASYTKQ